MTAAIETVTVLITDLVGSTASASRLGPAAADDLRRDLFGLLREAIEEHGGEEVKTTGDGLMAVFRGAAHAVSCAVGLQQRIERRNRDADEPLHVRVGVALGDVTREGGDCFGLPVVEAVRLCARADGGQILATDLVRVVGGRDGHPFLALGDLELRGLPRPVPTCEVGWEPARGPSGRLPLPARLRARPPTAYVGRAVEGERVQRRWEAARRGARQAVLVSGEPGIGKTRFTVHAACELHAEGAIVLAGHAAEGVRVPYGPWIEALGPLVEHAPEAMLEAHVERHGGELARLVPALARRVPRAPAPAPTDPETERWLLFTAVAGMLELAGEEGPAVLLLDDLHWADAPTLALLRHVLTEAPTARLLLLGTYRDTDLGRDHPLTALLADLRREAGIERLALRGLDADAVASIMAEAAGHPMSERGLALAREITAETDGNPFFAGEILRHLAESGALAQGVDGRWELQGGLEELGLPQSVREVVHRRVERLGEHARGVLSSAAVIGREFDLDLLVRVVREDDDELIDLLDAAVEASLLQERADRVGGFGFAHNLITHTLYDALGASRRARLHRRVAEALEDLCGEDPGDRVAELARHWTAATAPVEPGKAIAYSRRAGERALAELAPDEAARWFGQALELTGRDPAGDDADRCELAIRLGEAERQAGRPCFRETLLDAARLADRLDDPDRLARAALANNRGFASAFGTVDAERVAVLERALQRDPGTDPARAARLLTLEAMELQFDPDHVRRRALADRGLALARQAGDPRALVYVLRDHFHAVWSADTLATRRRTAEEMTTLAEAAGDPLARFWALDRTLHAAVESGRMARAAEAGADLVDLAAELGQPVLRWHASSSVAGLAQLRGELDEAERLTEVAVHLGRHAGEEADAVVVHLGQLCVVRVEQGRAAEVVELLEQAAAHNPGIPAFQAGLAATLCEVGRGPDAAVHLERAAADGFASVARDQIHSTALATWAWTAGELGSASAAGPLYDRIVPWRELVVWNGSNGYGSAEHWLGLLAATLGSHDRAREHFAAASALHEREGLWGWEARNLAHAARSRSAAGDPAGARVTAQRALDLAGAHGHEAAARRARAVLDPTAGAVPSR
jgi:class 3 adenylate cyclase